MQTKDLILHIGKQDKKRREDPVLRVPMWLIKQVDAWMQTVELKIAQTDPDYAGVESVHEWAKWKDELEWLRQVRQFGVDRVEYGLTADDRDLS